MITKQNMNSKKKQMQNACNCFNGHYQCH